MNETAALQAPLSKTTPTTCFDFLNHFLGCGSALVVGLFVSMLKTQGEAERGPVLTLHEHIVPVTTNVYGVVRALLVGPVPLPSLALLLEPLKHASIVDEVRMIGEFSCYKGLVQKDTLSALAETLASVQYIK